MAINKNAIFSGFSVLADLLNNLGATDTVAIFDINLQQVFQEGRPLKADIKETSMIMNHPVETGTILSDNHIINPIEINIPLFVNSEFYNLIYGQIKQAFIAATPFSIQTRTAVYPNMIIADMPHVEDADVYNAVIIALHFKEVLYIVPASVSAPTAPANFNPADAVNSNTVQAGAKYPNPLSARNTSAVQSILTGFAFKSVGRL